MTRGLLVVTSGPYRSHVERPPICDRHAGAPATERCARCGSRACEDCVAFVATRVLCAGCARAVRRRAAILRPVAALALMVAGALAALVVTGVERPRPRPVTEVETSAITLKYVRRYCDENELGWLLTSLEMQGRDRELVASVEAFADGCAVGAQTAGILARARRRLAQP